MWNRRQRGMTLLELLVVVGIISILSALTIWNYLLSINRAKQSRTMADMRTIGLYWEVYAQDFGSYIPAAATFEFPETTVGGEDLKKALLPKYMTTFPVEDGWGHPYEFALELDDPANPGTVKAYAVRSRGADGEVDASYDATATSSFNNDIVFSNGSFIISPKNK